MSFASTTNPVVAALTGARDTELADLGVYYVAVSPTIGTGNIGTASVQAFTETTPILIVVNTSSTVSLYPMQWNLHCTVVGATAATIATMFTFTLDTGNRYSSAGTILTNSNTNMASTATSAAIIYSGAPIATAASGTRRVVAHCPMEGIGVNPVHHKHSFIWGGGVPSMPSTLIDNTTTLSHQVRSLPPMVIGPNQSMVVVRWSPAITTAPTYEHEFTWVEK